MSTKTSLILFFVLLVSAIADAATIKVPNQAATILKAVELAASGDVILLTTDIVDLGGPITIKDKNLFILGQTNDKRSLIHCPYIGVFLNRNFYIPNVTPTISLERSEVFIRNVIVDTPCTYWDSYNDAASPIVIHSGTLRIVDSTVRCSIESSGSVELERTNLSGYSKRWNLNPPHDIGSYDLPVLRVQNGSGITINIHDSTITGDYDEALTVENISNVTIQISNSTLSGGIGAVIRDMRPLPGFAAVAIRSCSDFIMESNISIFRGGYGTWSWFVSGYNPPDGNGGNGLTVDNSTGIIRGGIFLGNVGAGGVDDYISSIRKAGSPGGNGVQLIRSNVAYSDIIAVGGAGGGPSRSDRDDGGPDGLPIMLDEFSIFTEITGIDGWMQY